MPAASRRQGAAEEDELRLPGLAPGVLRRRAVQKEGPIGALIELDVAKKFLQPQWNGFRHGGWKWLGTTDPSTQRARFQTNLNLLPRAASNEAEGIAPHLASVALQQHLQPTKSA